MKSGAERAPHQQASAALNGRLNAVSLFDLCQFLMLNRKTGTLTVRSDGRSAYFTFQDGQLMTALDEAFRNGEAVVLEAVQWPDGEFSFAPGPVPPDRKINASTENILLEAARRIDEMQAADQGDELPSHEEEFREKQARAEGLAEAFRTAVTSPGGQRQGTLWKSEILEALRRRTAVCAIFGPGNHIALAGPNALERIDGVPRGEWLAWVRSLCGDEVDGGKRVGSGPGGRFFRSQGMSLNLRIHGGEASGQAILSRLWEDAPSWKELGLEEGIYRKLEAGATGPWIVLDTSNWRRALRMGSGLMLTGEGAAEERKEVQSSSTGSNGERAVPRLVDGVGNVMAALSWGGPALCGTAAWLRRRMEERPGTAWIVEHSSFYDWTSISGCVRSLHPSKLRRQGHLTELCDAVGANTLVLGRPWHPSLAEEAACLAGQGVVVVILDHAPGTGEWIRRRRVTSPPGGDTVIDRMAGIWSLSIGPDGSRMNSTLVLPKPAEGATKLD